MDDLDARLGQRLSACGYRSTTEARIERLWTCVGFHLRTTVARAKHYCDLQQIARLPKIYQVGSHFSLSCLP